MLHRESGGYAVLSVAPVASRPLRGGSRSLLVSGPHICRSAEGSCPPEAAGGPPGSRARLAAGGARDNGDAAIANRACHRRDHHLRFLPGAWLACIGSVDIVATAQGKIIPSGRTKLIQPFETGVERAIHVRNGQRVKAGEVLIELDPTMAGAQEGHLKSDLVAAELEASRLPAALVGKNDIEAPPGASCAADRDEAAIPYCPERRAQRQAC